MQTLMPSNIHLGRSERNYLVNKMSIFSCAILIIALSTQLSYSVIIPPRLYIPFKNDSSFQTISPDFDKLSNDSGESYVLSINEGTSKSVPLDSKSAITINLNRAISQNLDVQISVFSSPDLISFDHDAARESISIKYLANTFGDRVVQFYSKQSAGHAEIVCKVTNQPESIIIDDSSAYISLDIYRNWNLNIIMQIVGWIYFFAWSISFYFQFLLNYQRKSVVGLNFDFLAFNLLGFTCYSIYNMSLLFSYDVQQNYYKRYTYSRIPVEYNDLFFGLHASLITLITVIQCCVYERAEQQVSLPAIIFLALSTTLGFGLYISSLFSAISILDVVFYLSYVKLVITVIKYVPQAYMNYKRKATTGWSIHNIILDFTGGSFSFMQMILIAYNYNDWISIFGNFTKFGLAIISMKFDILFLTQHYILYRGNQPLVRDDLEGSTESVPSPVISQSIRSANFNQIQQQQQTAEDSDEMTERDD